MTSTSSALNTSVSIIDSLFDEHFADIGAGVRNEQRDVIESILDGHNTLSIMPTGGGKSLCYWIAGLALGGTTLVIFPLTALMDEQALKLRSHGLEVAVLHSGIPGQTQYTQLIELYQGKLPDFIFTSPERLATDGFLEYVLRRRREQIELVVIDEVHCISQWGHDFRPFYTEIPPFLDAVFGDSTSWPTVLGLTATLNRQDTAQICTDFHIGNSYVLRSSYLLRYAIQIDVEKVEDEETKDQQLWAKLEQHRSDKVLIYVDNRDSGPRSTEGFAAQAQSKGFKATHFHGSMTSDAKAEVIQKFKEGYFLTIFATSAFGMGIDIPDIRGVIHYRPPESVEQYYQQIGRVGRDGRPSWALLYYSDKNISIRKSHFIDRSFPREAEINSAFATLTDGRGMTKTFNYFGEEDAQSAYHYLVRSEAVAFRCKSVRVINTFRKAPNNNLPAFDRYQAATRTGLTIRTAVNAGVSIEQLTEDIYGWLAQGKIRAERAPQKCLIIDQLVDTLPEELVASILEDVEQKKQYRHGLLDEFAELLEAYTNSINMHQAIGRYLGVDKFQMGRVHQTKSGAMVRSKSEVIIANLLSEYEIPFLYEEILQADGVSFSPDFTVRAKGQTWYWEHLGMLDLPQYHQNWQIKRQWYEENFPGQLITTREGSTLSRETEEIIVRKLSGTRLTPAEPPGETRRLAADSEDSRIGSDVVHVRVFTEGRTDWKHLKAAWTTLKAQGRFSGLEVDFQENERDMGGAKLLSMCEYYSLSPQPQPTFFVFDRDVSEMLRKATEHEQNYKKWGNDVFSVALPVPPHREATPDICIEFYYTNAEITQQDENGRRLYIGTEFDSRTSRHNSEPLLCTQRNKTGKFTIVDADVFSTKSNDDANVALSKSTFAEYVLNARVGFDDFDFSAFVPLFSLIWELVGGPTITKRSITDSHVGRRPNTVRFLVEEYEVSNWKEVLVTICEALAGRHPTEFAELVTSIGTRRRKYATSTPEELVSPVAIRGTDLWIETNLSVSSFLRFIQRLRVTFGYDENAIVIGYTPQNDDIR